MTVKDEPNPIGPRLKAATLIGGGVGTFFALLAMVIGTVKAFAVPTSAAPVFLAAMSISVLYIVAGILGGALVGLLLPIGRWYLGRILLSILAVMPVYCMVEVFVVYQREHVIRGPSTMSLWLACFVGGVAGASTWKRRRTGKTG